MPHENQVDPCDRSRDDADVVPMPAEAAAIAMTSDRPSYGTFELCAAGFFDGNQVAAVAASILGRPIKAIETAPNQDSLGLPDGAAQRMKKMVAHYDRYGLPGGNPLVLEAILRRESRTLSDYFRELHAQVTKGA